MTLTKFMARSTWVAHAFGWEKLLKCHMKGKASKKLANGQNIDYSETRIVRESDYSPASQLFCRVKKTMTGNYHKLDLVNIDAHTKFGLIMSIRSQDIERKQNSDLNKGP